MPWAVAAGGGNGTLLRVHYHRLPQIRGVDEMLSEEEIAEILVYLPVQHAKAMAGHLSALERELSVAKAERDRYRKERRELLNEALTR